MLLCPFWLLGSLFVTPHHTEMFEWPFKGGSSHAVHANELPLKRIGNDVRVQKIDNWISPEARAVSFETTKVRKTTKAVGYPLHLAFFSN